MRAFLRTYFIVTGLVVASAANLELYRFYLWSFWGQPPDWRERVQVAEFAGLILVVAGIVLWARPKVGLSLSVGGFTLASWLFAPPLLDQGWWVAFGPEELVILIPPLLLLGIALSCCVAVARYVHQRAHKRGRPHEGPTPS